MGRTIEPRDWPATLRGQPVAGLYVEGCVDGRRSFRAKAHAHSKGPWRGWICVRAARRLEDDMLMLHELAHLVAGCGHTDKWRAAVLRLGGTLHATASLRDYHKRIRRAVVAAPID